MRKKSSRSDLNLSDEFLNVYPNNNISSENQNIFCQKNERLDDLLAMLNNNKISFKLWVDIIS